MTPSENLIILDPAEELVFVGPFNRQVHRSLKIINPHQDKDLVFKIRTTSPKLFCVRPNVGQLGPEAAVDVEICLLPFNFDEPSKRHKFLVQTTQAPPNVENVSEFWKHVDPGDIWDAKIRCALTLDINGKEAGSQVADKNKECTNDLEIKREDLDSKGEAKTEEQIEKVNPKGDAVLSGGPPEPKRKLKTKRNIFFYGTFFGVIAIIVSVLFTKNIISFFN